MTKEWLVTGQGYLKDDQSKQTILLHEAFQIDDDREAEKLFRTKFSETHNIIKVYSVTDVSFYSA